MHTDSYELVNPGDTNSAARRIDFTQDTGYKVAPEPVQHTSYPNDGIHQPPQEQDATHHRIFAPWSQEILASVVILGAPLAMTGTLYAHAGQVAPHWPLKITINALLSIYSVVFRACVGFVAASCIGQLQWTWFKSERPLYDVVRYTDASQGPWGSFRWLCTHHLRQPLTALGAIILVLAVALDPFVQQLVRSVDCMIASAEPATLPRANYFADTTGDAGFSQDLASTMERALVAPTTGIEAHCPTGNCTFPREFGTLAYCSRCEDSSEELTVVFRCFPGGVLGQPEASPKDCEPDSIYSVETSLPEGPYSSYDVPTVMNVSYSLLAGGNAGSGSYIATEGPEVFKIDVFLNETDFEHPTRPGTVTVRLIAGKTPISNGHFDPSTGVPLDGCNAPDMQNDWRCRGYGAATCTLSPCVRMYNATVVNGRLTETLVSESGSLPWGTGFENAGLSMLDTLCLTEAEREHLRLDLGYKLDPKQRWVGFNASSGDYAHNNTLKTESLLNRRCLYTLSNEFIRDDAFVQKLEPYMVGNLRGVGYAGDANDGLNGILSDHFQGDLLPKKLYSSGRIDMGHIENTFANLSESLTKYLRTHASENYSTPAHGVVNYSTTCIEVQWPWLTYPAVIALLTLVLLSLVISVSYTRNKPVWKASPLVWIHQSSSQGELGRWWAMGHARPPWPNWKGDRN
ncbi:hypothetical protein PG993_007851 [Apiospora rasikravindrae]|uniref:Uncharacterized protein n=1 Tax=Apiospora rasikravindrae TaxID=990691 RepID=A0ABR1T0F9_9PEZI